MPRPSGLTLEDLRALYRIVKEKPATHTAAADLVGFNRQRLSRLIQRVNERIGEGDLDWRYSGRFVPPPEARRIAKAFEGFEATLADIEGSPRVSAGTTASLLLAAYLRQTGRSLHRLILLLRSFELFVALENDVVDIAFAHGESVGFTPSPDGQRFCELNPYNVSQASRRKTKNHRPTAIEGVSVLEWEGWIIRPRASRQKATTAVAELEWESGSTGSRLAQAAAYTKSASFRIQCHSFLEALEFVRRGLASHAVVPNIYLRESEPELTIEKPTEPIRGHLVAMYRAAERARWEWLLNTESWRRFELV